MAALDSNDPRSHCHVFRDLDERTEQLKIEAPWVCASASARQAMRLT
jgi:hypothetical protein